jgi:molybdenum storage protein
MAIALGGLARHRLARIPKKNRNAKLIPKITAQELLDMDPSDLVIERVVLEYMQRAVHVREVQVISGLKSGNLTRALASEHVGTIIIA